MTDVREGPAGRAERVAESKLGIADEWRIDIGDGAQRSTLAMVIAHHYYLSAPSAVDGTHSVGLALITGRKPSGREVVRVIAYIVVTLRSTEDARALGAALAAGIVRGDIRVAEHVVKCAFNAAARVAAYVISEGAPADRV